MSCTVEVATHRPHCVATTTSVGTGICAPRGRGPVLDVLGGVEEIAVHDFPTLTRLRDEGFAMPRRRSAVDLADELPAFGFFETCEPRQWPAAARGFSSAFSSASSSPSAAGRRRLSSRADRAVRGLLERCSVPMRHPSTRRGRRFLDSATSLPSPTSCGVFQRTIREFTSNA